LELTVDTIDVESAVLSEERFSEIAENGISEDELDEIYFENETTIAGCEFKSTVNGEVSEDARVELKNQYSQEIERLSKEQPLESNENASPLIRREGMVENARYKLFIFNEFDPAKLRLTLSNNCFLWQRRTSYYNFDIEYDGRELEYCDADETNYSEAYLVASDGTAYEIETVDD
jgi:hypothetical protein